MNLNEKLSAEKIARLMRAARKKAGLSQVEVAQKLSLSQGALSRTENGILIPSAPIWFDFCNLTGISPDCLVTGFIERSAPAFLESHDHSGFKLNKRYQADRGSKVRAMRPFLHYFESVYGAKALNDYLRAVKVDPDFVMDLDNQVNLNFCLDLSARLIQDGHLKPKSFPRLIQSVNQSHSHGSLQRTYDSTDGAVNRLQALFMNARYYECNFDYQIEHISKNLVELSVTPNKHLERFDYRTHDVLGDFLCRYKKHYFERFAHPNSETAPENLLVEKECHYHGGGKSCVYQLKTA